MVSIYAVYLTILATHGFGITDVVKLHCRIVVPAAMTFNEFSRANDYQIHSILDDNSEELKRVFGMEGPVAMLSKANVLSCEFQETNPWPTP